MAPAPAAVLPAEPPRRRSTIREPAPVARADAPAAAPAPAPVMPAPEPVVSSTAPEPAAPKRGWWGKRLLGGN
jgi:ribonuclease E